MALKFKDKITPQLINIPSFRYEPIRVRIMGLPHCIPNGVNFNHTAVQLVRNNYTPPPLEMPGSNLPRSVSYLADKNGCGFWRLIAPDMLLDLNQKAIINESTVMVTDPRWYQGVKSVVLQRQATPHQLEFLKILKELGQQLGFKIIYEIDDIVIKDDIPLFNRCREAFESPEISKSIIEMMQLSDEITVTCDFMKEYYKEKTGNKKISVIPNYPGKFWFDRYYNEDKLEKAYYKNKKMPKIGAFISGTHIDVQNKTNQRDDYTHVIQNIIKSRKDIKWVWTGSFPLPLKPYIDNGEMEYRDWTHLLQFPQSMYDADLNLTFVALEDNTFNRAKSDIKLTESSCIGYPCICQDMCTYERAILKFKNGDELIDQIKYSMKDIDTYMKLVKRHREHSNTMWLDNENNLMKHYEAKFTNYGDSSRKYLLETNPEQKIMLDNQ